MKLLPHQEKIARYMVDHDRLLVYHALGSGKTYTAIAAARYNNHLKTIVMAYPKLVIKNFMKEELEFKSLFPNTTPAIEYQTVASLARLKDSVIEETLDNSFIILDEAHLLRREGASKIYTKLRRVLKRLWKKGSIKMMLLTGTPTVDKIDDMHDIMALLDIPVPNEYKHVSYMAGVMYDINFVGEKVGNIPWKVIPLEITGNSKAMYKEAYDREIKKRFYSELIDIVLESHVKQDAAIESICNLYSKNKESRFFIFCERIGSNGIAYLREEIENSIGENPFVITGETSNKVNPSEMDKHRIIIGSVAASEGLSIKGAQHIYIITPHWNITQVWQVIGRGTRFTVDGEIPRVNVYCYVAFVDSLAADPKHSIDLYKYFKSSDKYKENVDFLSHFRYLIPEGVTVTSEIMLMDVYEDLIEKGSIIPPKDMLPSIVALCRHRKLDVIRYQSKGLEGIRIISNEREINKEISVIRMETIDRRDELFARIHNMTFSEQVEFLERSFIDSDYQACMFFSASVVIKDDNVYHVFMYREPLFKAYNASYFLTRQQGLTRKLKQLATGEMKWVACSEYEEKDIWDFAKAQFHHFDDKLEVYYSLSDKKFKLRYSESDGEWGKRTEYRGRNLYSFSKYFLIDMFYYVSNEMLYYTFDEEIVFSNKKEIISNIIWMFYNSRKLKFL